MSAAAHELHVRFACVLAHTATLTPLGNALKIKDIDVAGHEPRSFSPWGPVSTEVAHDITSVAEFQDPDNFGESPGLAAGWMLHDPGHLPAVEESNEFQSGLHASIPDPELLPISL